MLFDFSLAGTPDSESTSARRLPRPVPRHRPAATLRPAAERYAAAVTLHEMASGELPCWGDGVNRARLLDPAEEIQLAEDSFDPVLRDRLVAYFGRALHRDPDKRFGSLKEMTRAWTDVFRDLDMVPPLTTSSTIGLEESADADEKRKRAAVAATAATPLAAAGLSPRALSIAQQQLGISTVGELVRIPARRVSGCAASARPRYELVRQARDWRGRLRLSETAVPPGKMSSAERAVVQAPHTASSQPGGRRSPGTHRRRTRAGAFERRQPCRQADTRPA